MRHRTAAGRDVRVATSFPRLGAVAGLLLGSLVLSTGAAEAGFRGWGPRVGVSDDPDQVHVGVHFDLGPATRRVRLQPNLELGFGSDRTLAVLNLEGTYRFRATWDSWSPYAGGGLGIGFVSRDDGRNGGDDTEIGLSAVAGVERGLSGGDRFFLEVKLGFGIAPDAKVTIGWTFD